MEWIYIFLNFMVLFVYVHGKPYSIHVSIHYPKGNKRPEIYVSEGEKGKPVKDVEVVEDSEGPQENPQLPSLPYTPEPVFPEGNSNSVSDPEMVVPTDTERYHMKQSMLQNQNENEIVNDNTEKEDDSNLDNIKQDDHRPEPRRRRHGKKHFKETYWNYKNMPPPIKKNFRPHPHPHPRHPQHRHAAESSQTYDMDEVKAYERLPEKLGPLPPEEIEYREGDLERPGQQHLKPVHRPGYQDSPLPSNRGPAEEEEKKETHERADDYESYHPFRNKKEHAAKTKTVDYKALNPYHPVKKNKDYSVVNGCSKVGHMMPNPEDRCGYLQCVHAEEQHYSKDLVAQERKCAPGTAVPFSWTGGLTNPCTEAAAYCKNVHEVEDIDEEEALNDEPNEEPEAIDAATKN